MNHRWFLLMSKWARNPPSEKRVRFFLAIVLICLLLFGIERIFGWPEMLTPNRSPAGRITF